MRIQCDADGLVALAFEDDLWVAALFEHQGSVRVPEIVEAHGRDGGLGDQFVVGAG